MKHHHKLGFKSCKIPGYVRVNALVDVFGVMATSVVQSGVSTTNVRVDQP